MIRAKVDGNFVYFFDLGLATSNNLEAAVAANEENLQTIFPASVES